MLKAPYDQSFRAPYLEAWRALGVWRDKTLGQAMAETAAQCPDVPMVLHSGTSTTEYLMRDIHRQGLELASALYAIGLRTGDVIAVQTPNWLEGVLLYRAAAALGCVILPIVHIFGPSEVSYLLQNSGAKIFVSPDRWRSIDYLERLAKIDAPKLEKIIIIGKEGPADAILWPDLIAKSTGSFPAPNHTPDDVALLLYTSGTTAAPKGVLHSSNTLLAEMISTYQRRILPGAATLSPWPAGHIAGVLGILRHAIDGTLTIMMDQWDANAAAELIERYKIGACSGTPFHVNGVLDAAEADGRDISTLKDMLCGATTVPPTLVDRCAKIGLNTYRSYGSSEHPTISWGRPSDPLDKRLFTDGGLTFGNEVRIIDDDDRDLPIGEAGEILSRGPEMFLGYLDPQLNDAAFIPGGWFRTGDIGRLDRDGFLAITDRKKDIIIRGGENISSLEVEDLMLKHPQVADVAAVAKSHERLGEVVCTFVVLRSGDTLDITTVRAHFEQFGVAKQKTPEHIEIIKELPRTPSGKVKKHELRDLLKKHSHRIG
jgi:acyl-CoA synthetase (AMP-forming)/AMP-acid ligase II